jgi:CheY-like chemotaxis protein
MPVVLPCPLWPVTKGPIEFSTPPESSRLRGFGISFNCISAGTNTLGPVLVVRSNNLRAVLIVEDEPLLCLDISDSLSAKRYEVIAVTNADDAIKALEFRNDIHTIFTVNMPGSMDGLKLAAAVRDRWPPMNIIVTTGMKAPHRDELPGEQYLHCQAVSSRRGSKCTPLIRVSNMSALGQK